MYNMILNKISKEAHYKRIYDIPISIWCYPITPQTPVFRDACVLSHWVMSDSEWLHGLYPVGQLCPWNFPGKNTGVGCRFLLQGIFPTQGSNLLILNLLYWQVDSLPLVPPEKPCDVYICDKTISVGQLIRILATLRDRSWCGGEDWLMWWCSVLFLDLDNNLQCSLCNNLAKHYTFSSFLHVTSQYKWLRYTLKNPTATHPFPLPCSSHILSDVELP